MRRRLVDVPVNVRGAHVPKIALARGMRAAPTPAELAFWRAVRGHRLGARIRRQHVIAGFIVDFYCSSPRLAIEIDGDVHAMNEEHDALRTRALGALGVAVLRFGNDEVL